ncbi:MAG: hypothetical protein IJH64_11475 [Oscillospiraceae bacterium]|nr:hypothetical protein [Oscillospiraceae bacterium]
MKRLIIALMLGIMMVSAVACDDGDSDYNLENYDYNDNDSMEDNEFQDAVNDYMDDNGY